MRNTITRTTIASLAALSLMGSLIATAEPAVAAGVHVGGGGGHVGGFHGGGGGFHGGGFHGGGGGWHGGGGGWHGGGGGWHGGGWGGAAVVGGLAAGALLAAPYAYGNGYGGYGGCVAPIYDAYGNYLGQQRVSC